MMPRGSRSAAELSVAPNDGSAAAADLLLIGRLVLVGFVQAVSLLRLHSGGSVFVVVHNVASGSGSNEFIAFGYLQIK